MAQHFNKNIYIYRYGKKFTTLPSLTSIILSGEEKPALKAHHSLFVSNNGLPSHAFLSIYRLLFNGEAEEYELFH